MKKTLIYPFNANFITILNHCDKIKNLEITSLISPLGWGLCGNKFQLKDKLLEVSHEFSNQLIESSLVWFVDDHNQLDLDKFIIPKIKESIEKNKDIIYSRNDFEKLKNYFSTCELEKIKILEFNNSKAEDVMSLSQINTPVLFICDLYGGLDTFDINLKISDSMKNKGYSVLQVSHKLESSLFGIVTFPKFMFDRSLTNKERILNFNKFIKEKEILEKPDLIIIEVPGELYPFSKKMVSNFGIMAYEISHAIPNDCGILCMPSCSYQPYFCEDIINSIKGKFGINIDYFNIENKNIDDYDTEVKQRLCYIPLDDDFKLDIIYDDHIFNLLNNDHIDNITNCIINQLKSYACINSI